MRARREEIEASGFGYPYFPEFSGTLSPSTKIRGREKENKLSRESLSE
jgi:hypothetical protein